ncbi:Elongation factor Tu [bacterium AB1]|nr:Elongation factor Tu [bacterium AB1]
MLSDKKRRVNVCTIGHVDHGKTTLTSAITKVATIRHGGSGKFLEYQDIDRAPEEKQRGITINAAHVPYETQKSSVIHVDCPGHADYVKNMIVGSTQVDFAVLVIDVFKGIQPQTKEHILLIDRVGVPSVCVFLNKMDLVKEEDMLIVDLITEEIQELLNKNGYKDFKIIQGSALLAINGDQGEYGESAIDQVLDLIDSCETRLREIDQPFLMQIEDTCTITGRGTVATGRVVRGKATKDMKIEIVGTKGYKTETVITGVQMFRKTVDEICPGDDAGVLVRGVDRKDIGRGFLLVAPNSVKVAKKVVCTLYVLSKAEGGRSTGFSLAYAPQIFIRSLYITCSFTKLGQSSSVDDAIDIALPGDQIQAEVEFIYTAPVEEGLEVIMREGNITIACGRITSIIS